MGVVAGLYVYDVVVKKSTFALGQISLGPVTRNLLADLLATSSPDEFLLFSFSIL